MKSGIRPLAGWLVLAACMVAAVAAGPFTISTPAEHYISPQGQISTDMVAPYTGAEWPNGRSYVFADLAGSEVAKATPVGEMGFNDIGRKVLASEDLNWFADYLLDLGKKMQREGVGNGEPPIVIWRYLTGAYGAKMPDGRLHAAYYTMMSSPWMVDAQAKHNLLTAAKILRMCEEADIDCGVYLGTVSITSAGKFWDVEAAEEMVEYLSSFDLVFLGYDYISGAESVTGKPANANWQDAGTLRFPWHSIAGADPNTTFTVPNRKPLVADDFMQVCQSAYPEAVHAVESSRPAGRSLYRKCGDLRMIVPASVSDHQARFSPFAGEDNQKLVYDCWLREYLNPGVPQFNLFDASWRNKTEELVETYKIIEGWPGEQIFGLTVWAGIEAFGIDPRRYN